MDFDFKLQKSLKSLQATLKKTNYREVSKKKKIRERDKKSSGISFNFYIFYLESRSRFV